MKIKGTVKFENGEEYSYTGITYHKDGTATLKH